MNIFGDILTYAFRGSGKYVLITCVLLSIAADLAYFAPIVGLVASALLGGYFCALYFQLIQSSATGGKEAPEYPSTSNIFEDIIWPMLQIFMVALVSFGPWIGYLIWVDVDRLSPAIDYGLLGFGILYFPMALLAVVVLGHLGALSPHIVIPAIYRGGWLYWVGVFMLCLLYYVKTIIWAAMAGKLIAGTLVMSIVGAYTLMTNARILGVVYREREEDLGWL